MGQKIHPTGFRLAVSRNWSSRWFETGERYAKYIVQAHAFFEARGPFAIVAAREIGGAQHLRGGRRARRG